MCVCVCVQIFDNVKTIEDLYSAEKALLRYTFCELYTQLSHSLSLSPSPSLSLSLSLSLSSFRKSYNIPHPSLPRVVTRACIRVQKPKKALQFIKHKVCIYVHICMCVCIHVYIYVCVCMYMCIYNVYVYVTICMCVYIIMCIFIFRYSMEYFQQSMYIIH